MGMRVRASVVIGLILVSWGWFSDGFAVVHGEPWRARNRDGLVQFGTLDQLNRAVLDGPTTVEQVARSGDFGLGTFNALDGEMMVLDGTVYKFTEDGSLTRARRHELSPFAVVSNFHANDSTSLRGPLASYDALKTALTGMVPLPEQMLALRIHGTFATLKTRAPRRQSQPYPSLGDAVKTQVEFSYSNVRGTMLGFRLPAYLGTANATGYHFHFVSDDRRMGGHVLEVAVAQAQVDIQYLDNLQIHVVEARGAAREQNFEEPE